VAIAILVGTEEEISSGKGRLAYTTVQASARLGVHERTFRALVEAGEISPYEERFGPFQLWEEGDVEQLRSKRLKRF
jgi:hypothetical protein